MIFALFGIENDGVNLVVNLLVFFLVVIWLALVYWTYADAQRRLDDPMLIGCATAASLFPFIGTIVYTIVRPPEYLEDARERELEIKAADTRLHMLENRVCRNCGYEIEPTYLRCPSCLRKLKEPCRSCGRPLDPRWRICPFCEADVVEMPAAAPARAQRRARRQAASEQPAAERPGAQRAAAGQAPSIGTGRPATAQRRSPRQAAGDDAVAEPASAPQRAQRRVASQGPPANPPAGGSSAGDERTRRKSS